MHKKIVKVVPELFRPFQNYNDVIRKKKGKPQLHATALTQHSSALYSILLKPYTKLEKWKKFSDAIYKLAECLDSYKLYLEEQAKVVAENRAQLSPVRSIGKDATIEHKHKTSSPLPSYELLDRAVQHAGVGNMVMFDEEVHVAPQYQFISKQARHRFLENLMLSIPVDILRWSPGGSVRTTVCIIQVFSIAWIYYRRT